MFKGITGIPDRPPVELITAKDMETVNSNINYVMAACHSLVYVDKVCAHCFVIDFLQHI